MTIEQIQAELAALVVAMMDKGIKTPNAEFCISANESRMHVLLRADQSTGPWLYGLEFAYGENPRNCFDIAAEIIAAVPSKEHLAMKTYLGKLADAVDYGHENGIAAEYVDPVRITQKAMSDNLLTADAKAVA